MKPEYENMDQRDLNDMMAKQAEESGHTHGPITFEVDTALGRFFAIDSNELPVAMFLKGREEAKANATVFTEAINVATESGLTPKQLWEELKRAKDEIAALKLVPPSYEGRMDILEVRQITAKRFFDKPYSEITDEKDRFRLLELTCVTLDELRYAYAGEAAIREKQNKQLLEQRNELLEALEMMFWAERYGEYEAQKQGKPRLAERWEICRELISRAKGQTETPAK